MHQQKVELIYKVDAYLSEKSSPEIILNSFILFCTVGQQVEKELFSGLL